MVSYIIQKLDPEDYNKCSNIWDMEKQPKMANMFYEEIISGNRITFVYIENNTFIGEGSLVFSHVDPDYTVPNKRVYLSRMIVKEAYRNRGIGGLIVDYLIAYAEQLGYKEIALGVDIDNVNARRLYENKGFTEVLLIDEDEYGKYVKLLRKSKNG